MKKNNKCKRETIRVFIKIVVIIYLMPLNYSEEIKEVETRTGANCITSDYSPISGKYYRFTFESISHSDNFKPVALLREIPKSRCNHWSLSMYNSEDNAIKAFNSVISKQKKKKGNLAKSYGDYLAVGNLVEDDGYKGPDNNEGHFEYFSNNNVDFESKFEIIKKLA